MQLLGGIQAGLGLRPQRIHALPWAGPVELTQRGLEASQFVHLATVVINAPVEAVQLLGARLQLLESEVSLSRERLIKLYKELKGVSPP